MDEGIITCMSSPSFSTGMFMHPPYFGRMRISKEESSCTAERIIDLISAVKELHGFSSQELTKLLRDSENFTIHSLLENGSTLKVDMEKLAGFLPLHLIAVLMSSDRDESVLRYLLCGFRLLHSLCDLAPRHSKLEQILLDDVKVSEQLLDLVIYSLVVLSGYKMDTHESSSLSLLHSALVTCSLYLLTGFMSSQWQDVVQVLLAHPKVDIFMDVAFGAVHVVIRFLEVHLSFQHTDFLSRSNPTAEQIINYLCQQCEASLQLLQSLCQQKMFRERLLRNKELCGNGGVLFLAQAILKLKILPPFLESSTVLAAVSRLKAKMLSILLHLCEAESISYLDEVASSPRSLDLAKSVALEALDLLKAALGKDPKHLGACSDTSFPTGPLRLNAMRLTDIFSDDSNFRSYITACFTKVLTAIFSLPHGDFLSIWCSSELPLREEDATLEYDIFAAAGWVLDTFSTPRTSSAINLEITLIPTKMPQATYAHQRTSLFVKVIANLHCFVPNICEEQERNLFLHKFLECMRMDPSKSLPGFSFTSGAVKAITVCKNLRSLLSHAESLIPTFLNEEDVQLLRVFFNQLQALINPSDFEENKEIKMEGSASLDKFSTLNINEHHQEGQNTGGCSFTLLKTEPSNQNEKSGNQKEEMSENSAFREEKPNLRNDHISQGDVMIEDRDKSGGSISGVSRENDTEVQNIETSGSDTSSTRDKNFVGHMVNGDFPKSSEHLKESGHRGVREDEKGDVQFEEKQPRKRKRTIMNDYQIALIEKALVDEPEMQRNAYSVQTWSDKLSLHGSEVTSSQLKNWINNRKARLARAGKDVRGPMEVDSASQEKQGAPAVRPSHDSPESPAGEDNKASSSAKGVQSAPKVGNGGSSDATSSAFVQCKPGQLVVLVDRYGQEIGKGKLHQVHGTWYGNNLKDSGTCVIDITELKTERWARLPYPSDVTGNSFTEAETKLGLTRVLWDSSRVYMLRPQSHATQN